MSEKRFVLCKKGDKEYIEDNCCVQLYGFDVLCEMLNELSEEKEDWKNNCLKTVNENSILWNEIFILREQGAEPSDAFKNYLNGLKNKIKKLREDLE